VHRVVRAALEWVRAEPEPSATVDRVVQGPDRLAPRTIRGARDLAREESVRDKPVNAVIDSRDDIELRNDSSHAVATSGAQARDVRRPPHVEADDWPSPRRSRTPERETVELTIGAIHVVVDAPPAPATMTKAQVASPQVPAQGSSPSASSSDPRSFARRRLPRL
jgi:hypothetical protein